MRKQTPPCHTLGTSHLYTDTQYNHSSSHCVKMLNLPRHQRTLFPLKLDMAQVKRPQGMHRDPQRDAIHPLRRTLRVVTFERLIQFVLAKNHPKVVNGTGVELHPEHHISCRVSVPLVVTLQL